MSVVLSLEVVCNWRIGFIGKCDQREFAIGSCSNVFG